VTIAVSLNAKGGIKTQKSSVYVSPFSCQ